MSELTVYKSDPSTGEIFETKEAENPEHKEELLSRGWWETPRWHRNPRPGGLDSKNLFERAVVTPYMEYPRMLHKPDGVDKDTKEPKWKTLIVKNDAEKETALTGGYLLVPNQDQHDEMIGATDDSGEKKPRRGRPRNDA